MTKRIIRAINGKFEEVYDAKYVGIYEDEGIIRYLATGTYDEVSAVIATTILDEMQNYDIMNGDWYQVSKICRLSMETGYVIDVNARKNNGQIRTGYYYILIDANSIKDDDE